MAGIGPAQTAGTKIIEVGFAEIATSAADRLEVLFHNDLGYSVSLTEVALVNSAAYTGAATNFRSISIVNRGTAGAGTTEIGSWDGDKGEDLVLGVKKVIGGAAGTPGTTFTAATVADGETITASLIEEGTGLGLGPGKFKLRYQ